MFFHPPKNANFKAWDCVSNFIVSLTVFYTLGVQKYVEVILEYM